MWLKRVITSYSIHYTKLYEGGRVSGLSNVAGERAELDLRGSLDNHAPLSYNFV